MDKLKVAVIGGSSGDALVESCKKQGLYSIIICGKENDRGYGLADENYVIDLKEKNKIVKLIKEKADCLLIGTGHTLAHEIAKDLFNQDFIVSINPEKAEYGKNKILAYDTINRLGYLTPKFRIISLIESLSDLDIESFNIPSVVKSENDSIRTAKANNKDQLKKLIKENLETKNKVIVEEFIDGIEYTIPVISDGIEYTALPKALYMSDINRIAVAHLRNFDSLDAKYDRKKHLNQRIVDKIVNAVLDVTAKIGMVGVIRYDLMVDKNENIYFLEINEVCVSRIGPDHYPWQEVNINLADEMVKNLVKIYINSGK